MQLMLYSSKRSGETGKSGEAKNALNMVLFTLECMARGGIHDHVGGGFHRYSVDECWHGELNYYVCIVIINFNSRSIDVFFSCFLQFHISRKCYMIRVNFVMSISMLFVSQRMCFIQVFLVISLTT